MIQFLIAVLLTLVPAPLRAVDIVSEDGSQPACQEMEFRSKVNLFADPAMWNTGSKGSPLVGSLQGKVSLMKFAARDFHNFWMIVRSYAPSDSAIAALKSPTERASTPVRVVPVKVCGPDTIGFVLESELERAPTAPDEELKGAGLPPSTYPNPIPRLKKFQQPGSYR